MSSSSSFPPSVVASTLQQSPNTIQRSHRLVKLRPKLPRKVFFPLPEYLLLFLEAKDKISLLRGVPALWRQRSRFKLDLTGLRIPAWRADKYLSLESGYQPTKLTLAHQARYLYLKPELASRLVGLDLVPGEIRNVASFPLVVDSLSIPAGLAFCASLKQLAIKTEASIDLTAIASLSKLETFTLEGARQILELTALSSCTSLIRLELPSLVPHSNLDFLCGCTRLEELILHETSSLLDLSGLGFLSSLRDLTLNLAFSEVPSLALLAELPKLESLTLSEWEADSFLLNCPNLVKLKMEQLEGLSSLACLYGCPALMQLTLHNCSSLTSLVGIGFFTKLQSCSLVSTFGFELTPLTACIQLRHFEYTYTDRGNNPAARLSMRGITGLPNLETVKISSNCRCDEEEFFSGCTKLASLSLSLPHFVHLTGLPKLRSLIRLQLKVGNKDYSVLNCPLLEALTISTADLVEPPPFSSLPNLRWLSLKYSLPIQQQRDKYRNLVLCRKLERVRLHTNCFRGVAPIHGLAELRELELETSRYSQVLFTNQYRYLTKLSLASMDLLTSVSGLEACPALEELSLHFCSRLVSIQGLEKCNKLKRLVLRNLPVFNQVLDLNSLSLLTELVLFSLLTLRHLPLFGKCDNLKEVLISSCPTFRGLSLLYEAGRTQSLGLYQQNLASYERGESKEDFAQLSSLVLDACKQLGTCDFLRAYPNLVSLKLLTCTELTVPNLNVCAWLVKLELASPFQAVDLTFLRDCLYLRELYLENGCGLSSLIGLEQHTALEILAITSATQLSSLDGLQGCSSLVILKLLRSKITSLLQLKSCSALQQLELQGAKKLRNIRGVQHCSSLQKLVLSSTAVVDLNLLTQCPLLNCLDVRDCARLGDVEELLNKFPDLFLLSDEEDADSEISVALLSLSDEDEGEEEEEISEGSEREPMELLISEDSSDEHF